jgi:ABC-type bacteriocin/lantibiotic exporter with double-glycine peptidase domain
VAGIFFLTLLVTLKMALTGIIAIIAYTILGLVCFQIVSRGNKIQIREESRSYFVP